MVSRPSLQVLCMCRSPRMSDARRRARAARRARRPRFRRRPSRSSGGMNGQSELPIHALPRPATETSAPFGRLRRPSRGERRPSFRRPLLQLLGVAACPGMPHQRRARVLGRGDVKTHTTAVGGRLDAGRQFGEHGGDEGQPQKPVEDLVVCGRSAATASSDTSPTSGAYRRRLPSGVRSAAGSPARRASRMTVDASRCARPRGIRGPFKIVHCALKRFRDATLRV